MCKKSEENIDPILLNCKKTSALWNSILGFFRLIVGHASSRTDIFWRGQFGSAHSCLEDHSVLFDVVYLDRKMIKALKTIRRRW
jgi:hypothetical protein